MQSTWRPQFGLWTALLLRFSRMLSLRISHEHARRRALGRDGGDTRHCSTKDGFLVPSDAPGFGMEIPEQWIRVGPQHAYKRERRGALVLGHLKGG